MTPDTDSRQGRNSTNRSATVDRARARSILYGSVSELLERGESESLVLLLERALGQNFERNEMADSERSAAVHFALFGRNIFPFASAFLEADGHFGGPTSEAFASFYDRAGWNADFADSAADHFGVQFRFLAFLARVESNAAASGRIETATEARRLARQFITDFVSPALPPFTSAIRRHGAAIYSSTLDAVWTVMRAEIQNEAGVLPGVDSQVESVQSPLRQMAGPEDGSPRIDNLEVDLDDPKSGIQDIVEYLLSCRRSGIFLSQRDITWLGRRTSLPRGFGSRETTLGNLVRSAAALDELEALVSDLSSLVFEERKAVPDFYGLQETELRAAADSYLLRLDRTHEMLERIAASHRGASSSIF